MKALDLFCGAGGASMGLYLAGFDVTGVDIAHQKNYPFSFIQGDACNPPVNLTDFDFIWASPPCQEYSVTAKLRQAVSTNTYPRLIEPIRKMLMKSKKPYVIENVIGSPLIDEIILCGEMFGLGVIRHRAFECNFWIQQPTHKPHRPGGTNSHRGFSTGGAYICVAGNNYSRKEGAVAMGIDWMTNRSELSEAIPPAYARFIAEKWIERNKK